MAHSRFARPRTERNGWKCPHQSKFWKEYWQRPGIREERRKNPEKYTNIGCFRAMGLDREYSQLLTAEAGQFADRYMKELEDAGVVRPDDVIIPDSDEALGKSALREAAKLALNVATPRGTRLSAINTVLAYTKAKPVVKTEVAVKSPEDWLRDTLDAAKRVP